MPHDTLVEDMAESLMSAEEAAQGGHALAVAHLIETTRGLNPAAEMATFPNPNEAVKLGYFSRSAPPQIAKMARDRIHAESGIGRSMQDIATVATGGQRAGRSFTQRIREAFRR